MDLAEICKVIYGAQQLAGKILSHRDLGQFPAVERTPLLLRELSALCEMCAVMGVTGWLLNCRQTGLGLRDSKLLTPGKPSKPTAPTHSLPVFSCLYWTARLASFT